jgi:peroxiredoxin
MSTIKPKKGLSIGTQAPTFEILDAFGNKIDSVGLLKNSNGLILEFYRGAF